MKPVTLVVAGQVQRGKSVRPIETPRDRIYARFETGNRRFTAAQTTLKEFAVDHALPWETWKRHLEKTGIMSRLRHITLTLGTDLPGASLPCYELNLAHALISEQVETPVDNVVALRGA